MCYISKLSLTFPESTFIIFQACKSYIFLAVLNQVRKHFLAPQGTSSTKLLKYQLYKTKFSFSTGRYIYFETSSPVTPGQQGIIESKIFAPTQATCMSFYYSMYGDTMGNLRVYIMDMDKPPLRSNGRKVWEMIGNQGKSWHHSNVTIASSNRFKVIIVTCMHWPYDVF